MNTLHIFLLGITFVLKITCVFMLIFTHLKVISEPSVLNLPQFITYHNTIHVLDIEQRKYLILRKCAKLLKFVVQVVCELI